MTASYSYPISTELATLFTEILGRTAVDPDDPMALQELAKEEGGNGNYENYNDPINGDDNNSFLSNITDSAATVYATSTVSDIDDFLNVLYGNSFRDKAASIWNTIGSIGGKVTDYIMKFYALPVSIAYTSTKYKFNTGWFDVAATELMLPIATQRIKTVDFGSVTLNEHWGGALDYETKVEIYLPYVGYQELDTANVMGKTLHLIYKIDVMSADCVAQIYIDGDCFYQFNGNCGYELPISADCRIADAIGKVASGVATTVAGAVKGG